MGPYWFFSCLFFVSLLSFAAFYINRKAKRKEYTTLATFLVLYVLGFALYYSGADVPSSGDIVRACVVSFLFYVGYLLGTRFKDRINYSNPFLVIGSLGVLCAGVIGGGKLRYPN